MNAFRVLITITGLCAASTALAKLAPYHQQVSTDPLVQALTRAKRQNFYILWEIQEEQNKIFQNKNVNQPLTSCIPEILRFQEYLHKTLRTHPSPLVARILRKKIKETEHYCPRKPVPWKSAPRWVAPAAQDVPPAPAISDSQKEYEEYTNKLVKAMKRFYAAETALEDRVDTARKEANNKEYNMSALDVQTLMSEVKQKYGHSGDGMNGHQLILKARKIALEQDKAEVGV